MRTDTIFYQLFQTFPSLLFELLGQPPERGLGYQFTSREIKELARRFDGLFLPPESAEDLLIEDAKQLIERSRQEISEGGWQQKVVELIETGDRLLPLLQQ